MYLAGQDENSGQYTVALSTPSCDMSISGTIQHHQNCQPTGMTKTEVPRSENKQSQLQQDIKITLTGHLL